MKGKPVTSDIIRIVLSASAFLSGSADNPKKEIVSSSMISFLPCESQLN